MRRLIGAAGVAAIVATAFAAWSVASPTRAAAPSAAAATAAKLPPLPANIKARKRWLVGVKCDAPPFGYIDVKGHNAGFDVEIARWFARFAFGRDNRVSFTCAPTP